MKRKEPSQRQLRVGEQIRHVLSDTLRRGHFDHVVLMEASDLSITEVRISPDLKNATAYVIGLGGADITDKIAALNDSSRVFQKDINRQLNLKFTPRIRFKFDDVYSHAQNIENILNELRKS
jgi:ribosome-binding factor A